MNPNIFSDLRKPGLVPGKSLSLSAKIYSVKEKYPSYNMTNRMRSIHMNEFSCGLLQSLLNTKMAITGLNFPWSAPHKNNLAIDKRDDWDIHMWPHTFVCNYAKGWGGMEQRWVVRWTCIHVLVHVHILTKV